MFLFLPLFLSFSTWVSSPAGALTKEKDFICGYKPVVQYVNSLISSDQRLILYYRHKLKAGTITRPERIMLTLSLMRYRLLPIKDKPGRCRFYSFLCLDKQKVQLRQIAEEYVQAHPRGPDNCYIRDQGREKQVEFLSPPCESAIKKRVRPIPFPLGIAQAGLESAWGSSYFAEKGYNFFGVQTVFASAQDSINNEKCIPARNNQRKCVYKFNSPENSFFIYAQTLNSGSPYIHLRNQRYASEIEGEHPCETALKMSSGLSAYAEDPDYKSKVQRAIRQICDIVTTCH